MYFDCIFVCICWLNGHIWVQKTFDVSAASFNYKIDEIKQNYLSASMHAMAMLSLGIDNVGYEWNVINYVLFCSNNYWLYS